MDTSTGSGGIEAQPDKRDMNAGRQLIGGVGADGHERAAAERDLSAIADENVDADGGERKH
jgi:hypothetical protein